MNDYDTTQCPLHLNTHTVIECSLWFRHLHMKLNIAAKQWNRAQEAQECWQDPRATDQVDQFSFHFISTLNSVFIFKLENPRTFSAHTYQMGYECNENGTPKRIRTHTDRRM